MAIPEFTTTPQTTDPDNFAEDMDIHIAELDAFVDALNEQSTAFALSVAGSSTTSLTIATGSQSLTVQTGLGFQVGGDLIIASTASPTNRMIGVVTAYNSSTGALEVYVSDAQGSGTFAVWAVSVTTVADLSRLVIPATGLTAGKPYYRTAASAWAEADSVGTGTYPARGVAISSTQLAVQGIYTSTAHGFTVGATLYLSETAGSMTTTLPSTADSVVQVLGWVIDANTIMISVSPDYATV